MEEAGSWPNAHSFQGAKGESGMQEPGRQCSALVLGALMLICRDWGRGQGGLGAVTSSKGKEWAACSGSSRPCNQLYSLHRTAISFVK